MITDGCTCVVVAWPGDLSQEIYLGGYQAKTPRLAVRWLQRQSARLANALDPEPGTGWAQGEAKSALRRLPDRLPDDWPDPGWTLREWQRDDQAYEKIMSGLLGGEPFELIISDHSAYYMLSARPLIVPCFMGQQLHEELRCPRIRLAEQWAAECGGPALPVARLAALAARDVYP